MENLAMEEDAAPESKSIRVMEEVRGVVPANSSCRVGLLFTRPEDSTEAAETLKTRHHPLRILHLQIPAISTMDSCHLQHPQYMVMKTPIH